jgi:hypothetical protein
MKSSPETLGPTASVLVMAYSLPSEFRILLDDLLLVANHLGRRLHADQHA